MDKVMDHITIGMMAKINGISEQTLRLYDKMKLLRPSEINPETGYRYYNIKQCAQLDMIQYMKALGMNLVQIKECFEEKDIKKMRHILELQKNNIEKQMLELHHAKQAIERSIESYRRYDAAPEENTVVLEYIKARKIFCFDTKINCYSYGMDYYEHILRSLKKNYVLHKLPMSYFCNVGSIMRKENFRKRELWATEVFLFVEDDFQSDGGIEVIPEDMYLCKYCYGFNKEEESLRSLMDYIPEHNYEVKGDCISEVLIEFPTFNHFERNAFLKLQVPVKQKMKKIF
ncbi:MerR family transcriptional regulator [Sinanaerobacter chloroacetimidivorans]|uniref:MerR family transcriptional regulator n=1 Tax=Sinanaerobacter chloroacetimidivorans TaxID=2818044 RepID=A0A8J7W190_9FIRM|nr:helix-turn-helix domain-containing protein [Sinanaerobacter chloroacetimidivorans]MBR0598947.1 MerR family transcriptional regulator [Sinanaerobacter chloroacetimidivorans]